LRGSEEETRGAEPIELCEASSKARSVQGETENDSIGSVTKVWEASARGYLFILGEVGTFFCVTDMRSMPKL